MLKKTQRLILSVLTKQEKDWNWNSHCILSLRFLFDNGEERFTFHSLLLLQLIEFLSEDFLMPLPQSAQHRSHTRSVKISEAVSEASHVTY